MVSTPSMPSIPSASEQIAAQQQATEQRETEARQKSQRQALELERNRSGRAETILTQGDTSMATTARKTLLGE